MPLLPSIFGAIAGPRRNPAFDPYDPNSRVSPFLVPETGLGRFSMRYGGFDPVQANLAYDVSNARSLQEGALRRELQTSKQEHDFRLLQSQLQNRAILEQYAAEEATRRLAAEMTGRQTLQNAELAERRGMLQQELEARRQLQTQELNRWMNAGQLGMIDPSGQNFYPYQQPTDFSFGTDPTTGQPTLVPGRPGGLSTTPFGQTPPPAAAPQSSPVGRSITPDMINTVAPTPQQSGGGGTIPRILQNAIGTPLGALANPAGSLRQAFVDPLLGRASNAAQAADSVLNQGTFKVGPVDVGGAYQGVRNQVSALGSAWEIIKRVIENRRKQEEPNAR